jgi:hypothetical protein
VIAYVRTCPVCHTAYIPEIGEICKCPDQDDEPILHRWEEPVPHEVVRGDYE